MARGSVAFTVGTRGTDIDEPMLREVSEKPELMPRTRFEEGTAILLLLIAANRFCDLLLGDPRGDMPGGNDEGCLLFWG